MNTDRLKVLKEFDSTRTGVKGLVDSGITSIPSFFHHPTSNLEPSSSSSINNQLSIPTVDLSLPHSVAVDLIRSAAKHTGFFHVINHGVPSDVVDRAISSVRCFNEMESDERKKYYSREFVGGVSYASNFDLFRADAASWRDTIQIDLSKVDRHRIPPICRDELMMFSQHVYELGKHVIGLLSEGLGVECDKLEKMTVCEGRLMVCHYYPWCPEPEKTVGITSHTDPGAVTVLAQDQVGGLQVKLKGDNGEWEWVDVKPVDGAFVINVGDLLQIISNDEYKSVEHRVIANTHKEARVSLSTFFNPTKRGDMTSLQKHVAFFDRDNDGVIYLSETVEGLRAIGLNADVAAGTAALINGVLSPKTSDSKMPDIRLPVYVKNIQRGIHGSHTGTYDSQGRFVEAKFEEIFQKHAHTNPNALTEDEVNEMLEANKQPNDSQAASAEWKLLYSVAKDKDGLLQKEAIRSVYDGSLFYNLEKAHSQKKNMKN